MANRTENTPSQELSVDTAAESLMGFLDTEDGTPKNDKDERDNVEQPELDEEELDEEQSSGDDDGERDEELDEGDADGDEDSDEDSDVEYITFEDAEGKEVKVTAKEYKEGWLRQQDYTRKTQKLAEDRKQTESLLQELSQMRQQLAGEIQGFQSGLQSELDKFKEVDWAELKQNDPEQYLLMKAEQAEAKEKLKAAEEDMAKLQQEQQKQNLELFNKARDEANQILSSEQGIPGWTDEKKGPEIRKNMREIGLKAGFTEEELNLAIDPRSLKLLWMASEFEKLQATKPEIQRKKKQSVPRVSKPNTRSGKNAGRRTKLANRLKQTGSARDAASLLEDMFGDDLIN